MQTEHVCFFLLFMFYHCGRMFFVYKGFYKEKGFLFMLNDIVIHVMFKDVNMGDYEVSNGEITYVPKASYKDVIGSFAAERPMRVLDEDELFVTLLKTSGVPVGYRPEPDSSHQVFLSRQGIQSIDEVDIVDFIKKYHGMYDTSDCFWLRLDNECLSWDDAKSLRRKVA